MSRLLTVSDELYKWLEQEATIRGLGDPEQVLERLRREETIRRRQEVGKRIDVHREEMFARHGLMPDSTELIREDRER